MIHLILTYKWFDMIVSGEKQAEYRKYSPEKWDKWLKDFERNGSGLITFQRGYTAINARVWIPAYILKLPFKEIVCNLGNKDLDDICQFEWGWNPSDYDLILPLSHVIYIGYKNKTISYNTFLDITQKGIPYTPRTSKLLTQEEIDKLLYGEPNETVTLPQTTTK